MRRLGDLTLQPGQERSAEHGSVLRSLAEAGVMARGKLVLTYPDYLRMPEDRNRRELLGGDLYVTPAPSPAHQRVVANLIEVLNRWVNTHGLGRVFGAPIDVVLSELDVVQPDVIFVSSSRLAIVTAQSLQGAPDLVVEVLSPSTAPVDRGRKMELYARSGVQEYWLVDPDQHLVEQDLREGEGFRLVARATEEASFTSVLLNGLRVELPRLWD